MSETSEPSASPRKAKPAGTREERLAEALRANLRRRKAARSTGPAETDGETADKSASESPPDRS